MPGTAARPERRHCSRNPKWGPSDVGCTKLGDGHGLRRPAFVLRPSRRALRAAPGLPQGLDAVSHGLAFRLRRRLRAALRRNARPYAFAGGVALRSSLTFPRFPGLLLCTDMSQATKLACMSICPGRRSPSMSFTSFSSSTKQLTQCVAKKSKGPRSGGAPGISGSRTSTLGVTARKPVCGTQAPKPQDTPWLPDPGDVTRALPQRSERGASRAAPRQMVQLGAPLPPGADQSGGQGA